jgi:hypothetical protein
VREPDTNLAPSEQPRAACGDPPAAAFPIAALTFLCSLGTGILWNALYFIAESEYGFTQGQSLLLAFLNGVLYTAVAVSAGVSVRWLERFTSPRGALAVVLVAQGVLAPLLLVFPQATTLWIAAIAMTALGALQWPIVQHYLVSGRHGRDMRNAIGWWNASWMAATAIGLAIAGPMKAAGIVDWAIPSLLPINLVALLFLARFPRKPPHHDPSEQARHVPANYRPLLNASRILHPMGYLVIGALSPILPYLLTSLGAAAAMQAPIGSVWHVARFVAVLVLWQTSFWHGRRGPLIAAGLLLSGGFAMAVASPNQGTLMAALVAIGLGQGAIYYSAIYYGLAVGGARVEAGGIHEALVGAGYFMGPLLGLASLGVGAGPSVFIGLVLGSLAIGCAISIWRAGRASSHSSA